MKVQTPIREKRKIDFKPYVVEIFTLKFNQWLQNLDVYLSVHAISEEKIISFTLLNLESHALTQWESYVTTRIIEQEPLVNQWETLKNLIMWQFYPIGYG